MDLRGKLAITLTTQVLLLQVFSAVSSTVFTKLVVHPGLLYFSCVPNKLISSSMYVRNFTGDHFAFRLAENYAKETERCFAKLPLYGIVPPRSIHTFGLTLQEREEKSIHLVLESSTIKNAQMPTSHGEFKGDKFFEEIKEKGNMVQQVKVKAVATAQREMEKTSEVSLSSTEKSPSVLSCIISNILTGLHFACTFPFTCIMAMVTMVIVAFQWSSLCS
jgi:hypothetical protein